MAFAADERRPSFSIDPSNHIEWEEFRGNLDRFSGQGLYDIEHAYIVARSAHRGQLRNSGEPYFSHPRSVALILLNVGVDDPDLIVAALLHDVPEDVPEYFDRPYSLDEEYFGLIQITKSQFPDWLGFSTQRSFSPYQFEPEDEQYWLDEYERTQNEFSYKTRIRRSFNERISQIVDELKKPDGLSKEQAVLHYYEQLKSATTGAILVKMADTIHNLWTMDGVSEEKKRRKVKEYKEQYMPIFESLKTKRRYPTEYSKLHAMLMQAIDNLEVEFTRNVD